MNLTVKEIAEKLEQGVYVVRQYLGRSDFAHIQITKKHNARVYNGITYKDLCLLNEFIENRKRGKTR